MLLRNTLYQIGGQATTKLLAFILYISLARFLSVEVFGQFNFIFAYAAIFGVIMDFGLDVVVAKRVTSTPQKLEFLLPLFKFKLKWVGLVLSVFIIVTLLLRREGILAASLVAGLGVGLYSLLVFIFGIYRGKEVLQYEAVLSVLQKALYLALAVLLVSCGFPLVGVFGALAVSCLVVLLGALVLVWKRYGELIELRENPGLEVKATILREALPLMFVSFFTLIYFRVDILMLTFLKGDYEVGIYSAAYRLMEGAMLVPAAFMTAFFPGLVRAAENGTIAFSATFKKGLIVLATAGFVLAAILVLGAEIVISLFWGIRYLGAVPVLHLLAVALLVIHFNYLITQSAIALNTERVYAGAVTIAAFFNIVLNFVLIRPYGAIGAAVATIVTELFLGLALFVILLTTKREFIRAENIRQSGAPTLFE